MPELSPGAADVWRRLAPDLVAKKVLTDWDREAFRVFCELVAKNEEVRPLLDAGPLVRSRDGGLITNPAWRIFRDSAHLIRAYAQEFGLTPAARASVSIADDCDSEGAALLRLLTPARNGPPEKGRDRPP